MHVLSAEEVARALPWPVLSEAIETMLRQGCEAPTRQSHAIAVPGGPDATLLTMPAWVAGTAIGVKLVTVFPGNARHGLPAVNGIYVLFDAGTGLPQLLMDADELTVRRTAAASAIAARRLARREASRILVVGTGRLAPALAAAHADGRAGARIAVWGRDPGKAAATAERLRAQGLTAEAAPDLAAAVAAADIVSCATLASAPLIHGEWLRGGTHLDLVGAFRPTMREADAEAMRRAHIICVDTREGALREAGDILQAIAEGAISRDAIAADLRELVLGLHPGRTSPDQITLFKSVGYALEDLAAARAVLAAPRPHQ